LPTEPKLLYTSMPLAFPWSTKKILNRLLVLNTATSVITYLAVFLIQNTQNRDAKAIQLKLDELISSTEGARNRLVDLQDLTDEELEQLQKQFQRLQKQVSQGYMDVTGALKEELDGEVKSDR
jgi:low affinity Fe/Cu permease